VVFDHTRRTTKRTHREKDTLRDPVPAPHSDLTDASAFQCMRDRFGDAEAADRLTHQFSIINAWHSMGGTLTKLPVTVCDARTINKGPLTQTRCEAAIRPDPSFECNRPN